MNIVKIVLGAGLSILAFVDARKREIPVLPVVFLGLFLLAVRVFLGAEIGELLSGVVPGLLLLVISFASHGSVGMGDGMMVCIIGIAAGLERTTGILGIAFLAAGIWAAVLLLWKKAGRKTELPFLPFLLIGYIWSLLIS